MALWTPEAAGALSHRASALPSLLQQQAHEGCCLAGVQAVPGGAQHRVLLLRDEGPPRTACSLLPVGLCQVPSNLCPGQRRPTCATAGTCAGLRDSRNGMHAIGMRYASAVPAPCLHAGRRRAGWGRSRRGGMPGGSCTHGEECTLLRSMLPGPRMLHPQACRAHTLRRMHPGWLGSPGRPPGLGTQYPAHDADPQSPLCCCSSLVARKGPARTRLEGDWRQVHSTPVLLCASQCCAKSCAPCSKPSELIML